MAAGTGSETQGAEELAAMVWTFVNTTGGLVHGLDTEVLLQSQGAADAHGADNQTRMS